MCTNYLKTITGGTLKMKSTSNGRTEHAVLMCSFSALLLERNTLIMRLFRYLMGNIRRRKWTLPLMRLHWETGWKDICEINYHVVGNLDLDFERQVEVTEIMPSDRKAKRAENEALQKYLHLRDKKEKQIILLNIYLDSKKNQKNIINLEAKSDQEWCRGQARKELWVDHQN